MFSRSGLVHIYKGLRPDAADLKFQIYEGFFELFGRFSDLFGVRGGSKRIRGHIFLLGNRCPCRGLDFVCRGRPGGGEAAPSASGGVQRGPRAAAQGTAKIGKRDGGWPIVVPR